MVAPKLTEKDIKDIRKRLEYDYCPKKLAEEYGVSRTTIYRRVKYGLNVRNTPVDIKNKIIKKIKEGYSKAEAAQMYGVPVSTVLGFTKGMPGYKYAGDYIIRKHGIELLGRLMKDGCLISDFVVSTVRGLQKHFPVIKSARYKQKTFFYLDGREEETIEAFFREKPDRIISYSAIKEMSYLLGVKVSKKDQRNLLEKYKGKHKEYWRSRRLIQRCLDDWLDDPQWIDPTFRLMPQQGEW